MAAAISAGAQSLEFSTLVKLFVTRSSGGGGIGANALDYAVASDGRLLIPERSACRSLVDVPPPQGGIAPLSTDTRA
jgi:hypothetical protein